MKVHPVFKNAVCRLWGHDYRLNTAQTEFVSGGQEIVCGRCGKEHFRSWANEDFPDIPLNSVRESMVNFNNRHHSELSH